MISKNWLWSVFVAVVLLASSIQAADPVWQVIMPEDANATEGGAYFPLMNAFDGTVVWDDLLGQPVGGTDGSDAPYYGNRYGYIDFGEHYDTVRICQTWTLYRTYSSGDQIPYANLWWDDDKSNAINELGASMVETRFNFNSAKGLSTGVTTPWVMDNDLSSDPITPKARYLILHSDPVMTNRAKEYAIIGYYGESGGPQEPPSCPTPPAISADRPELFDTSTLTLVDEIDCTDPTDPHEFYESVAGVSEVQTLLGQPFRVIPNEGETNKYMAWRIGKNRGLQAGKAYILEIDYPEDTPRSMFILNRGCEFSRGFHTGYTVGDALYPPYVGINNCESVNLGLTGQTQTWRMFFHLHDRFPQLIKPRGEGLRPDLPQDGFLVLVTHFKESDAPLSAGAAVSAIRLYEAPDYEQYVQPINFPPAELPRRHLFYREEMGEALLSGSDVTRRGLINPRDFYRNKARLMKFLGMNTFTKELLEFGHNGGWDSSKYSIPSADAWYNRSGDPFLWESIMEMIQNEGYELDVLPYYEYAGSIGSDINVSIGKQERCEPLRGPGDYTHIYWSENANCDVTDPDFYTEIEHVMDCTLIEPGAAGRPISGDNINVGGCTGNWTYDGWCYIDFGPNYSQYRIIETWTRSRMWHGGPGTPYQNVYWYHDTTPFKSDTIPAGVIPENTLNFITQWQAIGAYRWSRDVKVAPENAIIPQARYLILKSAPAPLTEASEACLIGWLEDGSGNRTPRTLPIAGAGSLTKWHAIEKLFDAQPVYKTESANIAGVWIRPRVSHIPVSFSDITRARFADEVNGGQAVSRANLQSNAALYQDYLEWWYLKRKAWLLNIRDYLRSNGAGPDAVVLYTSNASEAGPWHPNTPYTLISDEKEIWNYLSEVPLGIQESVDMNFHIEAQLLPVYTWSGWEWQHSNPSPDPDNYQDAEGVMMTYVFNKAYTVSDPVAFDLFRTPNGVAAIRHYSLNENVIEEELVGYFVSDAELGGPYSMRSEALAMANGDPTYFGYLSGDNFNRGFPEYARAFNAAYLSLPALPSTRLENASSDAEVVVRMIPTETHGTWLSVVNTGILDKQYVQIALPVSGQVTNAATGQPVSSDGGVLTVSMYPCQLLSFHIDSGSTTPAIPGDYNGDGVVDLADYTVWADTYGQTGSPLPGDGNGDGVVDLADYTVWADNYGTGMK